MKEIWWKISDKYDWWQEIWWKRSDWLKQGRNLEYRYRSLETGKIEFVEKYRLSWEIIWWNKSDGYEWLQGIWWKRSDK